MHIKRQSVQNLVPYSELIQCNNHFASLRETILCKSITNIFSRGASKMACQTSASIASSDGVSAWHIYTGCRHDAAELCSQNLSLSRICSRKLEAEHGNLLQGRPTTCSGNIISDYLTYNDILKNYDDVIEHIAYY